MANTIHVEPIETIEVATQSASTSIIDVNTGQSFATISDAINGSNAGDIIEIPGGLYQEQFPKITHNLTLIGVGSTLAHLESPSGQQPSNGEAILVTDANVTIDGLEFSGASVPDGNGAGIREESGSLTVENSYFHDNQDGLLTSGLLPGATLTIDHTEFNDNGSGSGNTHNLYVGQVDTLTVTNSYFTNAVVGHDIKSRALTSIIENNRIQDPTGSTSYEIDLPNGNVGIIENNTIEKGPNSENPSFVAWGEEAPSGVAANSSLTISGNTVIDDKGSTPFVLDQASLTSGGAELVPSISGNTFYGLTADQLVNGVDGSTYAGDNSFQPIGDAPTLVTSDPWIVPCYLKGTRIITPNGSTPVEELRVNDLVNTYPSWKPERVVWIGHKEASTAGHPYPQAVHPIKICAHAFAPGQPSRDLYLSPEHAVSIDDVLIPARWLINDVTITQQHMPSVSYYHVELPRHGVILAEGLPVESYLDTGYRWCFEGQSRVRTSVG